MDRPSRRVRLLRRLAVLPVLGESITGEPQCFMAEEAGQNEELRNLAVRRPFFKTLSSMMLQYMDDKKYKRELVDFDDD